MHIIELKDIEQVMEPIWEPFCRNKIYINENTIYKIYEPDGRGDFNDFLKHQEKFIDYLYSIRNINGCVVPSGKIYNDDKFIGISMHYYEYYINLEYLIANNIKIEFKLKILADLICALRNLHSENIIHTDLHLGNVITNLTDTRIIDLDEGEFLIFRDLYQTNDIKDLLMVILSVLYNIDIYKYLKENHIEDFLSIVNLPKDFKDYIRNQYYCKLNIDGLIYPNTFLANIDYEQIEYDKKKLNKNKI